MIFSQNLKVYLEFAVKAYVWARRGLLEQNAVIMEVLIRFFGLYCTIGEKLDICSELIQDLQLKLLFGSDVASLKEKL